MERMDQFEPRDCPTEPSRGVTVFPWKNGNTVDAKSPVALESEPACHDDVFRPEFLTDIIIAGVYADDMTLAEDATPLLLRWHTCRMCFEPYLDVPDGPYYMASNVLHSVWRVYEDAQLAFVQALWPNLDELEGFTQIYGSGNEYRGHSIVVLSRAYTTISEPELGSGLRVAVKDNYDMCSIKTSLGNRAYYGMSPISQVTAEAVSRLVDAGAQVVGKAHLSSFAMMEHPTQSVDYQAPFNPRGDGYLIVTWVVASTDRNAI